jgi:hypothetical protein
VNSLANDMSEAIPEDDDALLDDDDFDELADFQPADDDEAFLFSATDRPDEPVTAGMSFGAGPDFAKLAVETETQFRQRLASTLQADPSKDVQAFRAALERGF